MSSQLTTVPCKALSGPEINFLNAYNFSKFPNSSSGFENYQLIRDPKSIIPRKKCWNMIKHIGELIRHIFLRAFSHNYVNNLLKKRISIIQSELISSGGEAAGISAQDTGHNQEVQNRTDLHRAALANNVQANTDMSKLNEQDSEGRTAVHLAASKGSFQSLKILLKSGPNLNKLDKNEENALHLAIRSGQFACANFLVWSNSDLLDQKNADGNLNPIKLAEQLGYTFNNDYTFTPHSVLVQKIFEAKTPSIFKKVMLLFRRDYL